MIELPMEIMREYILPYISSNGRVKFIRMREKINKEMIRMTCMRNTMREWEPRDMLHGRERVRRKKTQKKYEKRNDPYRRLKKWFMEQKKDREGACVGGWAMVRYDSGMLRPIECQIIYDYKEGKIKVGNYYDVGY